MNQRRDIIIGGIVLLVIIVAGILIFRGSDTDEPVLTPSPESSKESEEQMESLFNMDIPDDVEKAALKDVTGGTASAISTRKYENGTFTHAVLADLPDPEGSKFYEGWLVRGDVGDDDFEVISTGKMVIAKGGYLLEFTSSRDLSTHPNVVITLETAFDDTPEKHILEGSF